MRAFDQTVTERKVELLEEIRKGERIAIRCAERIANGREDEKGKQMLDTLIGNEVNTMHRNTLEFLTL